MTIDTRVTTKRTLATLSHAIEELAWAAGPDAVLISLFQRGSYFGRMADRYASLAARGVTVIVAHADGGPEAAEAPGVHRVILADDDPLVAQWSAVVVTPAMAAAIRGLDLQDFDPHEDDLESGRRFAADWVFDREAASEQASELLDALADALPAEVVDVVRSSIDTARNSPTTVPEASLASAARVLVERLDRTQRELTVMRGRLAAETEAATRDPLTGLLNREGLERWLGGPDTDGLPMPPMGVVLLDLDGFKLVNDTMGHLAGDRLLRAVAIALLESTRPGDVASRWGGDEFVVLCPGTTDDELAAIAARLIEAISAVEVDGACVGASAGLQTCSVRPLPLARADAALYAAKAAGGGQAAIATA